jgi:hypothetical protein
VDEAEAPRDVDTRMLAGLCPGQHTNLARNGFVAVSAYIECCIEQTIPMCDAWTFLSFGKF